MKTILLKLLAIIFVISAFTVGSATLVSIGYGIYLWGPGGLPFNMALWGGFVLFIKMIVFGFIGGILSYTGIRILEGQ